MSEDLHEVNDAIRWFEVLDPKTSFDGKQGQVLIAHIQKLSAMYQGEIAALKYMVVQTIGGQVEGRPTNELNYLQRLRKLCDRIIKYEKALKEIANMGARFILPWTHENAADEYYRVIDTMRELAREALKEKP
jgi:hypothetical protein